MQPTTPDLSSARAGRAIGAMFFSLFGAAWLIAGCYRSGHSAPLLVVLIAICAAAIFAFAYRKYQNNGSTSADETGSPSSKRRWRLFNIINAAQWILILVVGNVLANLHLPAWVIPAIILIVGLHFLPLASLFSYAPHYLTGTAFILIAIVYPFITEQGPRSSIGCFAAGLVLWISALYELSTITCAPAPAHS